ncbi:GTPase activating protein [Angomonas deanei]|nr:GTPase activating protein [Angomonas deanei]|eukprot:EPY20839.1 GTPase activating protein [Angomonas deanei]
MSEGVLVSLYTTANCPHPLQATLSLDQQKTVYVRQCVEDFRETILLARRWGAAMEDGGEVHHNRHWVLGKEELLLLSQSVHWLDQEGEEEEGTHDEVEDNDRLKRVQEEMIQYFSTSITRHHEISPLKEFPLSRAGRFKPILADLLFLSQHVCVPLTVIRHHHLWLLLEENGTVTLEERLLRYRVLSQMAKDDTNDSVSVLSSHEVVELYDQLKDVLCAAWRQRERLWGSYRYITTPHDGESLEEDSCPRLPPLELGKTAVVPPSLRSSYTHRHRWERSLHHDNRTSGGTLYEEEDTLSFGPLRPSSVGIRDYSDYTVLHPLRAALRGMQITAAREEKGEHEPLFFFPSSGNDFQYKYVEGGVSSSTKGSGASTVAPLMDPSEHLFKDALAVPYLSPEMYHEWMKSTQKSDKSVFAACHHFSDDVWNIAVLFVESALSGFDIDDKSTCHLADQEKGKKSTQNSVSSGSVFTAILHLLHTQHGLSLVSSYNFLYATLYELHSLVTRHNLDNRDDLEGRRQRLHHVLYDATDEPSTPSERFQPSLLAREFLYSITVAYSVDWVLTEFVGRVAAGLRWRRSERWELFRSAALQESGEDGGESTLGGKLKGNASTNSLTQLDCSLDMSYPSSPLSPALGSLREGSYHSHRSAVERVAGKVESVLRRLQTPLLTPLLSPQVENKDRLNRAVHFCEVFDAWRRVVEKEAVAEAGAPNNRTAREYIAFTEFTRLTRQFIHAELTDEDKEGKGAVRYLVSNHPFIRGLIERNQLSSIAWRNEERRVFVSEPHLFLPWSKLLQLLEQSSRAHELEYPSGKQLGYLQYMVNVEDDRKMKLHAHKPAGTQEDFIARSNHERPSLLEEFKRNINYKTEISLPTQVKQIKAIREYLLFLGSLRVPSATPKTMKTATVKEQEAGLARSQALYLRQFLLELQEEGATLLDLPPTLRGQVWGVLLQVPGSRYRELYYYGNNACTSRLASFSDRQLSIDIPRCYPYHFLLSSEKGGARLERVIKSWLCWRSRYRYWQGLDTVAATLLTVSFEDEPLVLFQLDALIRFYVPLDEEDHARSPQGGRKRSMQELLHLFHRLLLYCDPQLAVHLFHQLSIAPELFAIRWFSTLFAHGAPIMRILPLWDYILLHGLTHYPLNILTIAIAIVMMRREALLATDKSEALPLLTSITDLHVGTCLHHATLLLHHIPSSLCHVIPGDDVQVNWFSCTTLAAALDYRKGQEKSELWSWLDAGLFLVDLRPYHTTVWECVIGSIHIPFVIPTEEEGNSPGKDPYDEENGPSASPTSKRTAQLLARRRQDVSYEIAKQVRNIAMAAIPPQADVMRARTPVGEGDYAEETISRTPPGQDCRASPHVVLMASREDDRSALQLLTQTLAEFNVPNVSVLHGGFEALRDQASHLVVKVTEEDG